MVHGVQVVQVVLEFRVVLVVLGFRVVLVVHGVQVVQVVLGSRELKRTQTRSVPLDFWAVGNSVALLSTTIAATFFPALGTLCRCELLELDGSKLHRCRVGTIECFCRWFQWCRSNPQSLVRGFDSFRIAHCSIEGYVFLGAEFLPNVRLKTSSVSINLFFDADIWNVENDSQKVFIE